MAHTTWSEQALWRRAAGILLLTFALISLAVGFAREWRASPSSTGAAKDREQVVVRYLHGDKRCDTCREIEERSRSVVSERFAEATAAGRLVFRSSNYDRPEERHYRSDYELAFGSVVVEGANGAWTKVDEVWDLVMENSDALEDLLEQRIRTALEEIP